MHLNIEKIGDTIAVIALNRPQAANALNSAMGLELKEFFEAAHSYRAIILTGTGKTFCAGADLKERRAMDEAAWHRQHETFEGALQAILDCPVPIIAAVNGPAFGAGLELALACDFIYAADNARFALTETTLGIIPGLGGGQNLARSVGMARAKELIFTGQAFSAQEALAWGMVNRVFPPETLREEAIRCAKTIAANAPLAVKAVKNSMDEGSALPLDEAMRNELQYYNSLLLTRDRHEGINAWNEKRGAVFRGE